MLDFNIKGILNETDFTHHGIVTESRDILLKSLISNVRMLACVGFWVKCALCTAAISFHFIVCDVSDLRCHYVYYNVRYHHLSTL